jgi:hypothetical protein
VTARAPTLLALALGGLGCGAAEPEPLARVVGAAPSGAGVPVGAAAEVRFSAPVDADGLLDGRRLVIAEAAELGAAIDAVEGEGGAAGAGVAARGSLHDGGRRVVLRPDAPLRAFTPYALVLSSLARAVDGRPVLDPDGRRRTFVATFETGAPDGPPPRPALTEARVDAETPEAGGEYVEVTNVGEGPLDLRGWRLAKRSTSGALSSCLLAAPSGWAEVAPGGRAVIGGGAWDARYPIPRGVPVLACGATALLGGLANDRAVNLVLADPLGTIVATLGASGAEVCAAAVEMIDPEGRDEPGNLACTEGSPGY